MKSARHSAASAAPRGGAKGAREAPPAMANSAGLDYPVAMKRQSRLEAVLSAVVMANSTTIKDLTRKFGLSEMTIRRDIEALETAGLLRSYRGGVIVAGRHARAARAPSYSLATAEAEHMGAKQAIARLAAQRIEPGDAIFLDSGSTIGFILDHVDPLLELTIFCYSLNIFNLAAGRKNTRVVFAGGVYHPDSQCCESPEGLALLNRNRSAKAFISANGLRVDLGVTTPGQFDVPIKRAAMANTACSFLVADSSKCGLVRTGHFANLDDFDGVISDDGFPADMRAFLSERDVELLLASPAAETDESSP
jgi:DeoR family transcriptional regulator, deoxyribose operon repressor